jgi:hypothetical protein
MRVAEFISLPGAGKTTLWRLLTDVDLGYEHIVPAHPTLRLPSRCHATLTTFVTRVCAEARLQPNKQPATIFQRLANSDFWRGRVDEGGFALFNEGLWQGGVNLCIALKGDVDTVREYFHMIPLPDVLLHIDVNKQTATERCFHRGTPPKSAALIQADRALLAGLSIARNRGCRVVHINGELSLTEQVQLIGDALC